MGVSVEVYGVLRDASVAVAVGRDGCPLVAFLRSLLSGSCSDCSLPSNGGYRVLCGAALAGRVLRVFTRGGVVECWVKLSGVPRLVSRVVEGGFGGDGVRLQVAVKHRYGALIRFTVKSGSLCGSCLSLSPPPGVLPKMSIVTLGGRVEIFFVFDQKGLQEVRNRGYRVVKVEKLELSDYMLTPLQEHVLYLAYMQGRYDYPRRVRLDSLARELNVSKPTLAEILRRAESKIMDSFIAHYMPHYYIMKFMGDSATACPLVSETRRKKDVVEAA